MPSFLRAGQNRCTLRLLRITLNGDPFELDEPLTVAQLLERLAIDARRVAVEHNLHIIRRQTFSEAVVQDGDTVEIVNFVGGGSGVAVPGSSFLIVDCD
jgi:thiamine biosynthesis protein ThiS